MAATGRSLSTKTLQYVTDLKLKKFFSEYLHKFNCFTHTIQKKTVPIFTHTCSMYSCLCRDRCRGYFLRRSDRFYRCCFFWRRCLVVIPSLLLLLLLFLFLFFYYLHLMLINCFWSLYFTYRSSNKQHLITQIHNIYMYSTWCKIKRASLDSTWWCWIEPVYHWPNQWNIFQYRLEEVNEWSLIRTMHIYTSSSSNFSFSLLKSSWAAIMPSLIFSSSPCSSCVCVCVCVIRILWRLWTDCYY